MTMTMTMTMTMMWDWDDTARTMGYLFLSMW